LIHLKKWPNKETRNIWTKAFPLAQLSEEILWCMINMEVNCEFNNLRCKESNCLYHNRSFVYYNKFRNFMTATHPCSRVSMHRIIECAVLYCNFFIMIQCVCVHSHCVCNCWFVSDVW
jgi:hypothetical protein